MTHQADEIARKAREDLLCELAEEGRLLPHGCSIEADFLLRWFDADDRFLVEWGYERLSLVQKAVRKWRDDPGNPAGAVRFEGFHRETWTSQYAPLDPRALEAVEPAGGEQQ